MCSTPWSASASITISAPVISVIVRSTLLSSLAHSIRQYFGNKKGTSKGPWIAHRQASWVGLSTPGGAPGYYEDQQSRKTTHECAPCSQAPFYMHCGSAGQAKCGGNPAARAGAHFKRAFEIGTARITAIFN